MPNKKGQLTVFIIIGIVILLIVSLLIYVKNIETEKKVEETKKIYEIPEEIKPIKVYMQSCAEDISKEALEYIGSQGGYYYIPDGLAYEEIGTALFFANSAKLPYITTIQNELSAYINDFLFLCLRYMENPGFEMDIGETNTITSINEDGVSFNIDTKIILSKEGNKYDLGQIYINLKPVRLKTIYEVILKIIDEHIKNPSSICLGCITDLAEKNNLKITINNFEENIVLYTIEDYNSNVGSLPYIFRFLVRLNEK